jgi:capsular exopolysaccharide synthesis family protein
MSRFFQALERVRTRRGAQPAAPAESLPPAQSPPPDAAAGEPRQTPAPTPPKPPEGLIPSLKAIALSLDAGSPLLPFDGSDPVAAEQYKLARTKILRHHWRPRSLVVSSAQAEDGKSISSINLAGCLALKPNTNVLLVDADMRRGQAASLLGVPEEPGLSDILLGRCEPADAIVRLQPFSGLFFLPRGPRPANAAELLDSPRWRSLAALLRREFHFLVFDAPPVGLLADFDLILDTSDGVVLVIRPDHTNRTLCLKVLESLPSEKLIGVLLNHVTEWFLTRPLGHRYDYYYEDPPTRRHEP